MKIFARARVLESAPPENQWVESCAQRRRRGVRWYLTLTFFGAWLPWLGVYLGRGTMDDPLTQLMTAAFVPALAACVVRRWVTREGFANSGLRTHLRSRWRHYLAAVTLPWGVLGVALMGSAVAGRTWSDAYSNSSTWFYLAAGPLICVVMAPVFWGEEYGWTAYLRDRLVPGRPVMTTFLTGTIWGVWHWPLPWTGYFGGATSAWEAMWAMILWLPLSILLEFVIGWLWTSTGSVWPGAMLHAGSNLVVAEGMGMFVGDVMGPITSSVLLCVGLTPFVVAIVCNRDLAPRCRRVHE